MKLQEIHKSNTVTHHCNMDETLTQNDNGNLSGTKTNLCVDVEIRLQDWFEVQLHHSACHAMQTHTTTLSTISITKQ